ncbi:iron-containing alcohol dehydrogenase [Desulfoluna sp.]|uniref:iron-containing alcohol dehydrogenase n=1 Tax=Desulfoluna sp. TaxID=2045199 RepID=UPI00261710C4|nr:iron-containing alcohol dehydrogenase [Desulfoluna sp.]
MFQSLAKHNGHLMNRVDEYGLLPDIKFGFDAVKKTGEVALKYAKNKKAIIITDHAIDDLGYTEPVVKSLEESGFTVDVFAQGAIEPVMSQVIEVCEKVGKGGYGIVIGFGGGSSLDRAKLASAFASMPEKLPDYVAPNEVPVPMDGVIPKILIPTTSGTGSEASNTAVVIAEGCALGSQKTWVAGEAILANAAILDPTFMANLPPRVTAATGLDALSHCAEGILSKQANSFSDCLSLEAVQLVFTNLRAAYHHGEDNPEARWNMAMSAMIGGMVISFGWVAGPATLGHAASEGISPMLNMSHGDACGVLLPYVYWYNLADDYAKKKLAMIAESMGIDTTDMTRQEAAEAAILETFQLMEDLDVPTSLKDYGMKEEDIPSMAEYILERAEEMYCMSQYNPRKATLENLKDFFHVAYLGKEELKKRLAV